MPRSVPIPEMAAQYWISRVHALEIEMVSIKDHRFRLQYIEGKGDLGGEKRPLRSFLERVIRDDTALSAMETQRRARAGLAGERNEAAGTLAALKTERASVAAKGRQVEVEAAPIRYVAELIGADAVLTWAVLTSSV